MTQHTKIVATIGPAIETPEQIRKIIEAGVSVFRFNLKHNTHEWHSEMMERVRAQAKRVGENIAIMIDLQGPELRIGMFKPGVESMQLEAGELVTLAKENYRNVKNFIPFDSIDKISGLEIGKHIFIDDGAIELLTKAVRKNEIIAEIIHGGTLGTRKSVNIPSAHINIPTLTSKDRKDLELGFKENVEFIALSFVRDANDIKQLRKIIDNQKSKTKIIAKIETLKAIENLDEIIEATDIVMVARGDLGVEIPIERLPLLQKQMIMKAREHSKPIIVATQMLQSMINNPTPTRAEVTDIANAVFDKTDALMLSEETAKGAYPVKAVQIMSRIARYNDQHEFVEDINKKPDSFEEIMITASVKFSKQHPSGENEISGYVVFTESGRSVRMLSRYRPSLPVYAFTAYDTIARQLSMSYGVTANQIDLNKDPIENIKTALRFLRSKHYLQKGQKVVVIFGNNVGIENANNNLTIVTA